MKTKLLPVVCCVLLTCYSISSNAQNANRTLSNLISPTAINESLLPGMDNRMNLGSGGRGGLSWKNLYLGNVLYLDGRIALHAPRNGNFFVGSNAGNLSLNGLDNTGVGQFSLFNLTSGNGNAATGYQALYANTTGYSNTAIGIQALHDNITGVRNVALGAGSLYSNDGSGNTANGYQALVWNSTGNYNSALGYQALYSNTTGYANTAVGPQSLYANIDGHGNTAVGYAALSDHSSGFYNTSLGFLADVSTDNLTNSTAIGYGAVVNASNKVRIGNTLVTSIGGQVGWSIFSDGRYKKDIKDNVQGLAFINSLRPITYTVNVQGLNEYHNKGRKQISNDAALNNKVEIENAEIKKGEDEASKIVYNGFIAQEVEEAAKKLNFEFSGVDKPQNKDGLYGLRYDNFVVPLVKAVQELSQQNDGLKNQNNELKKRIERLEAMMNIGHSTTNLSNASLAQNVPNPFTNTTTISYNLPPKFTTAQIIITDKSGKRLKQLNISGSGNGVVNINASALPAGAYNYSLIVDGRIISSKQMIVGK
jgi:hypothetical protein